jgi:signal peptidase II
MLPWLGLAIGIILIDQLTKTTVEQRFEFGDVAPVTGFFNLVLTYNKGAAFSFLASASGWQGGFLTAVAIVASIFILYLGNLIDRIAFGHVIDFLDFHWGGWHWPAFNLADSAIVGGAALLIVDELRRVRKAK